MASDVVARIKAKLSRRRDSFTASLGSGRSRSRSAASSLRSGRGDGGNNYGHDHRDPKKHPGPTPSQLPTSQQTHDEDDMVNRDADNDLEQEPEDLGASSPSSSSDSATVTTERTSHDQSEDKQRRASGDDKEEVTSEEKTHNIDGDGGAAKVAAESDGQGRLQALTAVVQVQATSAPGATQPAETTGPDAANGATQTTITASATAAITDPSAKDPQQGTATATATATTAPAPAGGDPPNRHQAPSSTEESQPASSSSSTPSPPSAPDDSISNTTFSTTSATATADETNLTAGVAPAQKPIPPPLPRQNSWQYRRPGTLPQLQAIDEDSDPPSPGTVPSNPVAPTGTAPVRGAKESDTTSNLYNSDQAKPSIADPSISTVSHDNDTDSSTGPDPAEKHDDSTDVDREGGIDKRLSQIREDRRTRAKRHANKQLSVTISEPPQQSHQPRKTVHIADSGVAATVAAAVENAALSTHLSVQASAAPRKQSLFAHRRSSLIRTLLEEKGLTDDEDDTASTIGIQGAMTIRKIWVKRPGASPTLVSIRETDLVDDVRDTILTKYGNSLGKTFDSPDLTLYILPREQTGAKGTQGLSERFLGPEESMCQTLDTYFPGGQAVSEALLINTPAPVRRHPKPSPRLHAHYPDSVQPSEAGEGYFPPVGGMPSPHRGIVLQQPPATTMPHSISVLSTGQLPTVPSPGGTRPRYHREQTNRPKLNRTHTQSPTIVGGGHPQKTAGGDNRPSHSRAQSNSSDHQKPGAAITNSPVNQQASRVATPPPRVTSPRMSSTKIKKIKKAEVPTSAALNGTVPPINVLIVEDNPINLKLLEAFVKKLKVRWSTAMNGKDAVDEWRTGGYHLVLMDIQLPVMNGLEATREIRRLERVNSIGVFTSTANGIPDTAEDQVELQDQDRLPDMSLFKSPVIIVALTASSLQSDRHEALAAGCNDFLTKPVNFVWLERKVMEWGCMQALIDFDGWRKWKDFSQAQAKEASSRAAGRARVKKNRTSTLATVTTTS